MPSDIPGVGGTPRLLPSSPIGPVRPSTALVPVAPVETRASSATPVPLGRSGLALLDVLNTTDLLVERRAVAPVALDVGLEMARGALLKGLAAESLATLDGVWERAQLTEEGWYLRSGALTVLGLPGEANRVSTEALQLKPSSVALHFMQSLARLATGDISGARGAIATAIEQQTTHPVLLMQQVIVLARQGNRSEAERLLQQVMRVFPDHPAVEVARTTLRAIAADQTRSASRSAFEGRVDEPSPFTTGDHDVFEAFSATSRDAVRDMDMDMDIDGTVSRPDEPMRLSPPDPRTAKVAAGDGTVANVPAESAMVGCDPRIPAANVTGTVAEQALARLGARLATLSITDAVREARMLIRAFSAGGSMAGACAPAQAHAARGVLTAIVFALNNGALSARVANGASSLDVLLSQWLPLLQAERFHDAARVWRRLGASIPDAQRRLLASWAQVPLVTRTPDAREGWEMLFSTGEYEALVQSEPARGPLIPVRLGLALLEERATDHASERAPDQGMSGWIERPRELTACHAAPSRVTPSRVTPLGAAGGSIEVDGRGWGTAMAASAYLPPPSDEGAGMRIAALLCVIIAAGAAMSGSGVIAVAFGVGAAWLGLRHSGRSDERPGGASDRDTTAAD